MASRPSDANFWWVLTRRLKLDLEGNYVRCVYNGRRVHASDPSTGRTVTAKSPGAESVTHPMLAKATSIARLSLGSTYGRMP